MSTRLAAVALAAGALVSGVAVGAYMATAGPECRQVLVPFGADGLPPTAAGGWRSVTADGEGTMRQECT